MRKLITIAFLFLATNAFAGATSIFIGHGGGSPGAAAAPTDITILQSTGNAIGTPAASITIQLASAPRSGSMFFLLAQSYAVGSAEPLTTPAGYSTVGSYNSGNLTMYVFSKRNYGVSVGSDTIATASTNAAYLTVAMVEYSTTSNTTGGFATNSGTGTSATVDVAVSGTGCVVMGFADHSGATTTQTAANSFVKRHEVSESTALINEAFIDYADGANINTGTYTPTLTYGASRAWIMNGWYLCQ